MTTKRAAGDLTTLWMDDDDVTDTETDATVAIGNDPANMMHDEMPFETHLDAEIDVIAHADAAGTNRAPKAHRSRTDWRRAERQRRAREAALQVLFEVDLVGHNVVDVRERQFDQMLLTDETRTFAGRLVDGVLAEQTGIDMLIASLAPAWPTDQLPRVDINVLRLALYELLVDRETPTGAIINEAVELAKQYGSENSGKFVNGVLGTVATRITAGTMQRSIEMIRVM